MSWDKNTHNFSFMDKTIEFLKRFEEPYTIKVLGKVRGMGLNDIYEAGFTDDGYPKYKWYEIRKLEYRDRVMLEQMHRTHDCDSDDTLISAEFPKIEAPMNWPLEIYLDDEDYENIQENRDD